MLPSLTSAFLSGLLAGSLIPFFPISIFCGLTAAAVGALYAEQAGLIERRSATMLYAAMLGGVVYWTLVVPGPTGGEFRQSGQERVFVTITGRVIAPVQHGPGRQVVLVKPDVPLGLGDERAGRPVVRLTWRDPDQALYCGDRIEVQAKFGPPTGSLNPGGFDYAAYLDRHGIGSVATVTGAGAVRRIEFGRGAWWGAWRRIDQWRAAIRDAAVQTFSQPALGLFLGITIGERGYLDDALQEWFMSTGTIHLLSISGSHLGLVAVIVFSLIRRVCTGLPAGVLLTLSRTITPTRLAVLGTWPVVVVYALMAGAELATLRSLVMITIALAVVWMGYERRLYHALASAAMLITVHDPQAIFDLSFQLSFLSVLVIVRVLTWRGLQNGEQESKNGTWWLTVTTWSMDALLIGGLVTMVTAPVVAAYFNQIAWMGILTNMIAIPFTGFVLVPVGLLTGVWALVSGAADVPLGPMQERLMSWMIDGLRWCAGFSMGEWHVAAPSLPSIALFYGALVLAGLWNVRRVVRGCAIAAIIVMLGWWLWSPRLGVDGDRWRVTFLDVGQGDSAVIELPDGRTVLIDGGAHYERFDMGRGVVAPFLWNRGIRRLDYVIGTHQQLDHVGGLAWVIRHLPVGQYWGTGIERPEVFATNLRSALQERNLEERIAVQGNELLHGGPCRLIIVNPPAMEHAAQPGVSASGTYLNNHSIVSRLECGAQAVLLTADIEAGGLQQLPEQGRQPVTVLKVPHHGARNSLDHDWIAQIHPQYAVVSVGTHNSYGHPARPVLDAFAEEKIPLYRTDRDGAVWFTAKISTGELAIHRMHDLVLRPTGPAESLWPDERDNWRRVWSRFTDE